MHTGLTSGRSSSSTGFAWLHLLLPDCDGPVAVLTVLLQVEPRTMQELSVILPLLNTHSKRYR